MLSNRVPRSLEDYISQTDKRLGRLERTGGRSFGTPPVVAPGAVTIASDMPPETRDDGKPLQTGDLWIDTFDNNRILRWNGSAWIAALDPSVDTGRDQAAVALVSAQQPADSADQKIVTYVQASAPTGALSGDLWIRISDNRLHRMSLSGWEATSDVETGAIVRKSVNAPSIADGRVSTWWQYNAPTADGFGDLWVDTSSATSYLYRWNNFDWVQVYDWAIQIQDELLKTKTGTYHLPRSEMPTSTAVGDIWYDTSDSNRQYRAESVGAREIAPGQWVSVRDTGIDDALDKAEEALEEAAKPAGPSAPPESSPAITSVARLTRALMVRVPNSDVWTVFIYEVATDPGFQNIVSTITTKEPSVQFAPLTHGVNYWVRVTATNSLGYAAPGPVSGPHSTIQIEALDVSDFALTVKKFKTSTHMLY